MEIVLCCPACKNELEAIEPSFLTCNTCGAQYPVYNHVPVLIDDKQSVYSVVSYAPVQAAAKNKGDLKAFLLNAIHFLQRVPPELTANFIAKKNYKRFADLIMKLPEKPKVLIIGGRTVGQGMEDLLKLPITFVASDIAFGPQAKVICDAHNLPFKENYFDGVIIQAVLEYLVDPYQCAAEIHRVLKPGMPVYSETPFIQQIHGREFDFTRFTHLGHRRVYRHFEEVDSGVCVGSGSALALSYKGLMMSFSDRKIIREFLLLFTNFTGFIFKYFDYLTIHKAGTYDAASGTYFLGTKSSDVISDRELVKKYRGAL